MNFPINYSVNSLLTLSPSESFMIVIDCLMGLSSL
ncbi:hypothetical protein EDC28_103449 [Gallaecimonas pentaromativorans]|uniref:Uncharacterized protein n=1 Tax=Gallaecimonas pentaromativorans TaxID=584787 RepID=A0A3N1PBQ9_9GAMM|nr:hypothetical protein EDC28_103449 [Gallaecimonas pentaromativorans]